MTKKHIVITIVVAFVMGGVGFFGGMKYGQSAKALANLTQTQRQQLVQSFRTSAGGQNGGFGFGRAGGRNGQGGGGFIVGEIISKDDKSVTIKTSDGGSKIVF